MDIVLETQHLRYVVGADGTIKGFMDKTSNTDYLITTTPVYFMSIVQNGARR
jgi:hypothetical protein